MLRLLLFQPQLGLNGIFWHADMMKILTALVYYVVIVVELAFQMDTISC